MFLPGNQWPHSMISYSECTVGDLLNFSFMDMHCNILSKFLSTVKFSRKRIHDMNKLAILLFINAL